MAKEKLNHAVIDVYLNLNKNTSPEMVLYDYLKRQETNEFRTEDEKGMKKIQKRFDEYLSPGKPKRSLRRFVEKKLKDNVAFCEYNERGFSSPDKRGRNFHIQIHSSYVAPTYNRIIDKLTDVCNVLEDRLFNQDSFDVWLTQNTPEGKEQSKVKYNGDAKRIELIKFLGYSDGGLPYTELSKVNGQAYFFVPMDEKAKRFLDENASIINAVLNSDIVLEDETYEHPAGKLYCTNDSSLNLIYMPIDNSNPKEEATRILNALDRVGSPPKLEIYHLDPTNRRKFSSVSKVRDSIEFKSVDCIPNLRSNSQQQ